MMTSENALAGVRDFIGAHVRDSDVIANFDHSVAVLMEETDSEGARMAIERYKRLFDSQVDLRFSIVTYPGDGGKPDGLIKTAYQRLDRARKSDTGSVVSQDD
jgi:GGDEF domain-containing protein